MAEFFHMGGYALYVWGSFGVTALLMLLEPVLVGNRRRAVIRRISRLVRLRLEEKS
jgi:heme exporter protein D